MKGQMRKLICSKQSVYLKTEQKLGFFFFFFFKLFTDYGFYITFCPSAISNNLTFSF